MGIAKRPTMKKIILLVFIVLTISKSFSQALTGIQSKRIAEFGKVWGLMKYYHPRLAPGNLNWNDTLRSYISRVKDCSSEHEFNSLLRNLLENIGTYRADRNFIKSKKYYTQTFETGWISKSQLLDSSIKGKLED